MPDVQLLDQAHPLQDAMERNARRFDLIAGGGVVGDAALTRQMRWYPPPEHPGICPAEKPTDSNRILRCAHPAGHPGATHATSHGVPFVLDERFPMNTATTSNRGKSLADMIVEVREVNTEKGWRTGGNTYGDYIALLHSELSEALEAYRDRRLAAYTTPAGKPDDVGSEFADVVIRLLDISDVHQIKALDTDFALADISPVHAPEGLQTFGDFIAWLHRCVDEMWRSQNAVLVLRALVTAAERFGVDLTAEYERKLAYNRTRPWQHGGRTLSEASQPVPDRCDMAAGIHSDPHVGCILR